MRARKKKFGVGIIGLGVGRAHLEAYRNNPYAEVIGICDTYTGRLKEVEQEYNIKVAVTDYKELLCKNDIDIISVCTPDHLHAEHVVSAMKAGKDVLCEKPLALTLEDCRRIIKVVDVTDHKFMIGQICRFSPAFKLAKKLIEQGRIGELFFVESEYAHNYRGHAEGVNNWRKSKKIKREHFLGGGCHAVDLLRWIAGDVKEAFAYANHKCLLDWPVDDCTIAVFKFINGVIGKVFVSIGCQRPYTMRSCFYGTKGTIICDNTSLSIRVTFKKGKKDATEFTTIPVEQASHNIQAEVDTFISSILHDKPIDMNAREGTKTVVACLAAIESVSKKKPIVVKNNF